MILTKIQALNVGTCRHCGEVRDFGRLQHRLGQGPVSLARSDAAKERWEDPEYQAKQIAAQKKQWQDPEYRAKVSTGMKKVWQDPEYRAKLGAIRKKRWQDPEYQAKVRAARARRRNKRE